MKIKLRKPLISDAKSYYEILNHPEFYFFPAKPKSIREEKDFLRKAKKQMDEGTHYPFAITAHGKHIGGGGFIIDQTRPYVCQLGFFVARNYWGKGVATQVVKMLEEYIRENLDIVRITICMAKENLASQRVAIKAGYKKEGLMKKYVKIGERYHDAYLYAKIIK
jgi:ribosomal-protein-alanine N-acetyltransferase